MPKQPFAIATPASVPFPVVTDAARDAALVPPFEVRLEVFSGPLGLLLSLIESRQLDVLSVPLADLADAYVAYLAEHPVEPRALAEFVAMAAQLILLKSRRLLPGEDAAGAAAAEAEEGDESELRERLVAYRRIRDAARELAALDLVAPAFRREPRDGDLSAPAGPPLPVGLIVDAMARLQATAEPEPPPPEVVAREVTIAMQIAALQAALAPNGRLVLQELLAAARSRVEATVTLLATLELVRRRVVRVEQAETFGPILVEAL